MKTYRKEHLELAARIYDLDGEVYQLLGSGLGRVYNGNRETTIQELAGIMEDVTQGHFLRSEMALIGNMARTIKDKEQRAQIMSRYNAILMELERVKALGVKPPQNLWEYKVDTLFLQWKKKKY